MSLFDLQDVCIAIGSLATLDLPMVVDLIGIYGLKGPYCTLTTTDWLLQALSVIPRTLTLISIAAPPLSNAAAAVPRPPPPVAAAATSPEIVPALFFEENPFVQNSSVLLVQPDEGVSVLVVDRIGVIYRNLPRRAGFL
ncbi:hypothetical protein F511_32262 [Dorcoceras hygrometricum]|uniref:Uncharacterized protein n=1 Tax=Dorcoceras hygrometricum TaxID=472368 RepID=A0A2Z7BZ92_9LAMI|nr:hypothetical protein F511_32262 [Dorcoceras hygrometricum]